MYYNNIIVDNIIIYIWKDYIMNYLSYFKNESDIRKVISSSIIKIRKNNNLTQEKLAEILDVSVEHISRIENCKYTCSITLIFKVCTIFKLSLDEFFQISTYDSESGIIKFLKNLSIENQKAIIDFCKEVENEFKNS